MRVLYQKSVPNNELHNPTVHFPNESGEKILLYTTDQLCWEKFQRMTKINLNATLLHYNNNVLNRTTDLDKIIHN